MIAALLLVAMCQTGQTGAGDATELRRAEGHVAVGTRDGQKPLANQLVVLHRVGHDRSGPLDSLRTNARGAFAFSYRTSGDTTAIYFATTEFGGIVYPTTPFRGQIVKGDDASIVVFDTTSGPVAIKIGGHHIILGAPQPNGRRPVGEVYDLENDTTVTLIARDSVTPAWTTQIPATAAAFQVNTNGEIASGALVRQGTNVGVFAPLSPGIRQVAFTYELPSSAFPLTIPLRRATGMLEVLVQEPTADVRAPALREVPSASADGKTFRRYLAQDLPASADLTIDVPRITASARESVTRVVLVVVGAAMILALALVAFRARRPGAPGAPTRVPAPEPRSRALVRAIAELDDEFDRAGTADESSRAAYQST
ncbi:MAG: hypothetical protein ACREPM_04015, partial [Gemmatimonadaceae bacterium]